MFENYGSYCLLLGFALVVIGWLWFVVRAYRTQRVWGVGCFFFPPAGIIFAAKHFSRVRWPLGIMGNGLILMAATFGLSYYLATHANLGERLKTVNGEQHLTLTGWDQKDYSLIREHQNLVVLQMANSDVTDQTLIHLEKLSQLRELDLNSSQITDDGLAQLAKLPALQILRLRKTKVTDAGFQQHLLPLEKLAEVDMRETSVASKTLRDWKKLQPEVRKFLK